MEGPKLNNVNCYITVVSIITYLKSNTGWAKKNRPPNFNHWLLKKYISKQCEISWGESRGHFGISQQFPEACIQNSLFYELYKNLCTKKHCRSFDLFHYNLPPCLNWIDRFYRLKPTLKWFCLKVWFENVKTLLDNMRGPV